MICFENEECVIGFKNEECGAVWFIRYKLYF